MGNSQGTAGTKVHVYLPYREVISFNVCIVPLGLISTFLYVVHVFLNFPILTIIAKKITYVIEKGNRKLHIAHYYASL